MTWDARALLHLLPAIHQMRDAEQGGPLADLLGVIAEQIAVIEEDLDQLYDDQFIETCADWVAPYIGALVGYRALHGAAAAVSSPRAEVANTIAYRRRKGTAAMLEQMAADVTGWPARCVEMFQRLATTQYLNHPRPQAPWTQGLRDGLALHRLGGAFDSSQSTIDVRSIELGRGRHNIGHVAIHLWRLGGFPLPGATPVALDAFRWRMNPLGADLPLFSQRLAEGSVTQIATPLDVPAPIGRLAMARDPAAWFGPGRAMQLDRLAANGRFVPVPAADVVVCDLSDRTGGAWAAAAPTAVVAIDPESGRLLFRDAQAPGSLRVGFHYGFAGPMGGGTYERGEFSPPPDMPLLRVPGDHPTISAALAALAGSGGVVEVGDSRTYAETPLLRVPAGRALLLRAANGARPLLQLAGDLVVEVTGTGEEASVTVEGLVLAGGALRLGAGTATGLRLLTLRHATLVPGLALGPDGTPLTPGAPSVQAADTRARIVMQAVISGPVILSARARLEARDTILDATSPAISAITGGILSLEAVTVIGRVAAAEVTLITDSILHAEGANPRVRAARVQSGCVRFSWLPPGTLLPARYRCLPEAAIAAEIERLGPDGDPLAIRARIEASLQPVFTARRYGLPGYAQLSRACPAAIRTGAADEGEQGAFHNQFATQREANLRLRLGEYLKLGLAAGIFYET
ncbi:hypothetical protein ACQW02_05135 [Humitalea sp. 24SJ18S-53]|uniref:hypothetical protein n=1 Tax=Humitalea sp. 24SJ18S-53 TaxID=3422307 RepID=UPI003D667276